MIRRPPRSTLFPPTTLSRSQDVTGELDLPLARTAGPQRLGDGAGVARLGRCPHQPADQVGGEDRKSTRLNSSHANISYAVFCLKKKKLTSMSYQRRNRSIT